jgi:hypothetical protein|tara:strand:- start:4024 stop:4185 length:162 start_codon:yes stop_codon:yes gene_type:complete
MSLSKDDLAKGYRETVVQKITEVEQQLEALKQHLSECDAALESNTNQEEVEND